MPRGRARDTAKDVEVIRILALVHDLSEGRVCLNKTHVAAWTQCSHQAMHLRIEHLLRAGLIEHDQQRGFRPTDSGRALLASTGPPPEETAN